jgi:uncharacterized protein YPO0396
LLIGDNGSGKSTAIDALRTLLVPPRLLNYNDASGDGRRSAGRDRTRRSYVRGAWASSSTLDSTAPSTQYLREAGSLSAIAAVFTDSHRRVSVTLAQVLWEHEEQVRELYAVAPACRSLCDLLRSRTNTVEIRRAAREFSTRPVSLSRFSIAPDHDTDRTPKLHTKDDEGGNVTAARR